MKSIRFLIENLGSYRAIFWILIVAGAIDGTSGFMIPILLSQLLKEKLSTSGISTVLPMIAVCQITVLIMQWSLRKWGESLTIWISNDLRLKLFRRAERLQVETLFEYHSGYLLSLIGQVSGSVGGLSSTLVWLVGHVVATMSLFMYFTAKESLLLAAINAVILVFFLLISVYLSRRIVPLADRRNLVQAAVSERFYDFFSNILTVRKLGIIEPVLERLRHESSESDRANFAFQIFHANRWFILHSIFFSTVFLTIAFLLYQIEIGITSASMAILFVAGFSRVQNYAERISEMIKGLIESDVYVNKLESVLSKQRIFGSVPLALPFEQIVLEKVSHRYGTNQHCIQIPFLDLRAGERVLISGQSGQGKSTLLSIVAGQLTPERGTLSWNQTPYQDFTESLGHAFALVAQETELFNLSLRENLSMDGSSTLEEMQQLLHQLGLESFLRSLPQGLDTIVGEKGLRLSAGQKQRVNLARALLLKRPILLLDEPTSHLDVYTEEAVVRYLSQLPKTVSMIIVSHRPVLRSICSREYRFHEGILSLLSAD